ncbi:cytochrome P450 [Diaporthe helianthi]|uniref:Cytochrome P450 n=1 Tax=Diaporthe helianthi TaxID=158607 RepID=A0A2P5HPR3_DIAHE|nr:cytochrome P450 [Diaporthe helianthi]
MPMSKPFLKFQEWSKQYGDLFSLKMAAGNLVIINNPKIVQDKAVPVLQYDEYYTRWRKTFNHILGSAGIKRLLPLLEAEASSLCQDLHRGESSFKYRVRSWSVAVPMVATSGQRAENLPPGFADQFLHSQEEMLRFLIPGSAPLVDYFPILKYVPEVIAHWKKDARRVKKLVRASAMAFYQAGREQYEQMSEDPGAVRVEGLIARLLREQNTPDVVKPERKFTALELGYIGQTAIGAAADTTAATLLTLMCCFAAFPHVLKKAQEEVDLVAGKKPPTGDMLGQLVYLKACISEVLRWRPVTPSALPHTLSQDDQYDGYFFPKGTTFIANAWAMHRDENDYEKPDKFMPERFVRHPYGLRHDNDTPTTEEDLERSGRRALYNFGFGRRRCPGEQFAFTTVMLAASKAVWAFDVLPPPGGIDLSIETGYKDDIVAEPLDPNVVFKFRDASREVALAEDASRTAGVAREMLG